MENFDIAKYLKEHQLGSYGILNHYVDMKPLKEEEDEVELNAEVPYEGSEDKLTGMGDGDNFNQAETVSEELEEDTLATKMHHAIDYLITEMGFTDEEIEQLPSFLPMYNNYMDQQVTGLSEGEMEEEWYPDQPTNLSKFISRVPNSMRNQSIVEKIMDVLNAAGISREDFKAFIHAVKTDPDALPLEEEEDYNDYLARTTNLSYKGRKPETPETPENDPLGINRKYYKHRSNPEKTYGYNPNHATRRPLGPEKK